MMYDVCFVTRRQYMCLHVFPPCADAVDGLGQGHGCGELSMAVDQAWAIADFRLGELSESEISDSSVRFIMHIMHKHAGVSCKSGHNAVG